MKTAKRTYAFPEKTIQKFEQRVASGSRSATLTSLVDTWLKEREKEELIRDIEEGCKEMWDVYLEFAKECEPMDAEFNRDYPY